MDIIDGCFDDVEGLCHGKISLLDGKSGIYLDIETRRKCPGLIAEKRFHLRRFISIALLRDGKLFPTILRRGDEGKFNRQSSLWRNCLLIILPREKLGLRQKPKGESGEHCRRSLTLAKRVGAAAGNHYPDETTDGRVAGAGIRQAHRQSLPGVVLENARRSGRRSHPLNGCKAP